MEFFQKYQQGQQEQRQRQFDEMKLQQQERAMQQEQTIGNLAKQYMQDPNPQTISQIAALSPQKAQGLMKVQQQVMQNKARGIKSFANTFNNMSESQIADAYPEMIKRYQKQGVDTRNMPLEYNKDTSQQIKEVIASESQKADRFLNPERATAKDVSGRLRYRDTQEPVFEGVQQTDKDRRIIKDVSGRQRYSDSGELVFPNIKQTASPEEQARKEKVLFDKGTTLRKEFTAASKDFVKVRDAYNRIEASASDPTAAGDLSLIFNYMKVLDPGSVVRESEFATAEGAGSVPQRIRGQYDRVVSGKRLSPEQRKDFVDRSDKLYNAQLASQKRLVNKFGTIAKRAGVDKQDVLLEFANETPEAVEAVKEVEGQEPTSPVGQKTTISEGRTMTNQTTGERFVVKGGIWSKV